MHRPLMRHLPLLLAKPLAPSPGVCRLLILIWGKLALTRLPLVPLITLATVAWPLLATLATITENWTSISSIFHNNNVISGSASVLASANIYSDLSLGLGGDQNTVKILTFEETSNDGSCPSPNPLGSNCDDYFTFDANGFDSIVYDDGTNRYLVEFQLYAVDHATNQS